ncbi:MAG: DNA repair protein RadC [Chloroflexota bacterium]|nr:DNA repair protein RadC [Chloroflexota bacterium]
MEYRIRINELPASERPRERLRESGPSSLSNSDLLAIVLRTGTQSDNAVGLANRLLARFGGLPGLSRASFGELCSEHGIGQAKAAQLKASLELGRRLASARPEERASIQTPQDAVDLLMSDMGPLRQEHLRVMLLNSKNQLISIHEVYKGSVNASMIRTSELFREAVRENCPAVIVVHNHPSGDPEPSADDIAATEQIIGGGKALDIEVLDHIIIGDHKFVSLKERGLIV